MTILYLLLIFVVTFGLVWLISGGHSWSYRNPYSRICKKCGRIEEVYGYSNTRRYDRWEPMNRESDWELCPSIKKKWEKSQ